MPVYRTARFTVKPEGLALAKTAIAEVVAEVHKHERHTRLYLSLQSEEDPHQFLHVMGFDDAKAEAHHRNAKYVKTFVALLLPLTEDGLTITAVAPLGMDAPGKSFFGEHKVVKKPQHRAAKKKLAEKTRKKTR